MTLEAAPEVEARPVSPELLEKVSALKVLTTIYKLLDNGLYLFRDAHAVPTALKFVGELHSKVTAEALEHPDCDLVPELVDLKEREVVES